MTNWELAYEPRVKPGPAGQEAFHRDRHEKRYRALYAGTGAGKTFSCVAEDLAVALTTPGVSGIVAAPDYPDVRRILYPIFETHLGKRRAEWGRHPVVARWRESVHVLDFRNGSRIQFLGLEDEVEGDTVNFVHVTEARLIRDWEDVWLSLKRRLRAKGYQGAWIDTHSPTKLLVDEFESGDPRYGVYRWSTRDAYLAGVITQEYYEDMVGTHHGARAQAVLEGLYARPEGLVYDQFDPSRHVRPRPDPPIPERGPVLPWMQTVSFGVDWGYTHAACITAWAWNGSKCHGVEEYWAKYRTTTQLVETAKGFVERWGHGVFWCGADEPGSVAEFRAAGLDARILPPEKRKVKDGVRKVNDMWHADELHVDARMRHFLDEVDQYANEPETDEPEKDAPDACDSGRYGVFGHARSDAGPPSTVRQASHLAPRRTSPGDLYGIQ